MPLLGQNLTLWGLQLHWLRGLLIFLAYVVFPVVLLTWIGVKWFIHRRRVRQAEMEHFRATHDPAGRPYPPTGRAMCQRCRQPAEKVCFLPTGERLCEACFQARQPATPPTRSETDS